MFVEKYETIKQKKTKKTCWSTTGDTSRRIMDVRFSSEMVHVFDTYIPESNYLKCFYGTQDLCISIPNVYSYILILRF